MENNTKICRQFLISGQVQGVWYRSSTQQQAKHLGLVGYARNVENGNVEVLACGSTEQLNELETWLWQGPPHARVKDVIIQEGASPRNLNSFETI